MEKEPDFEYKAINKKEYAIYVPESINLTKYGGEWKGRKRPPCWIIPNTQFALLCKEFTQDCKVLDEESEAKDNTTQLKYHRAVSAILKPLNNYSKYRKTPHTEESDDEDFPSAPNTILPVEDHAQEANHIAYDVLCKRLDHYERETSEIKNQLNNIVSLLTKN